MFDIAEHMREQPCLVVKAALEPVYLELILLNWRWMAKSGDIWAKVKDVE